MLFDKINLLQNGKSDHNVLKENPPRKKDIKIEEINVSDSGQNLNNKEDNNSKKKSIIISRKSKQVKPKFKTAQKTKTILKPETLKITKNKKINASSKALFEPNQMIISNEKFESIPKTNLTEEKVEIKELNIIPYSKALRIDNRNYSQIFLSVIYNEIKIVRIFYYKNPYEHLSIIFSQYVFELCLDLTFNCILYTEDVISEKYNNNGNIRFFTTLSLSFISNIISSIIAFIISKLSDYVEFFDFIIKDINDKTKYFLNMKKFKKLLCMKLSAFFFVQMIFNLIMCYYLMIFCTVYHKTQGSVMINYITGIGESIAISLGLAIITSLMRYLSIKCKWKPLYYTSKYFFENF